jgi:hypothetical protein
MNVICIDTDNKGSDIKLSLTIGKSYKIIRENNIGFYLEDDSGSIQWYSKWRFSISEWREKQLNKLL